MACSSEFRSMSGGEDEVMEVSDLDQSFESDAGGDSQKSKMEQEEGLEEGSVQPGGGEEIEGSANISFNPPVYLQRYCRVRDNLEAMLRSPKYKEWNPSVGKTVMEVGCAEFGMMTHLKNILEIGKIIFLDLDRQLLIEKSHRLKPLPAEYIQKLARPEPLVVEAYSGCITKVDENLHQTNPDIWAIVGIEIIEHLHPDVLRGFEETVFGILSPQVAVLTTPNSEFNEVFSLTPGKFRHWDHKFEWSRNEFDLWCKKIVAEFPCYSYRLEGICEGPDGTKHLGCVSQMAIFEKKTTDRKSTYPPPFSGRIQAGAYSLVQRIEYPNHKETRTPEEITLMEFNYHVNTFLFSKVMLDSYDELQKQELKVPFSRIQSMPQMPDIAKENQEFLRSVLCDAGFKIVTEDGQMNVIFNIKEYVAENLEESSDSEIDEEGYMCYDLKMLDVNRVIDCEEEVWE